MTTDVFFPIALVLLAFIGSCQMPKNQVLVLNKETHPVSFALSCNDRQTWKPATLEAHARERYQCDSPGDKMWVRLDTDLPGEAHQNAEMELKSGQRYEIYFDQERRRWNIQSVTGRSTSGSAN